MTPTAQDAAIALIARELRGLPVDLPATILNRYLRPIYVRERPTSYSTWRRAVRLVQQERSRWCEWEGRDPGPVRPRRRTGRARGVT